MAQNGAMGAITDVPGIRVGHVQKNDGGWLSGVTVVLPPPGTVGSVDVRGGGPGTHETDALDPTTLSQPVDAVVLTGGSAFGLVTAHGAQRWCEEERPGLRRCPAEWCRSSRPPPSSTWAAAATSPPGPTRTWATRQPPPPPREQDGHDVERGNVGAGTGAVIGRGQFKGGVGTASITLENGVVVGALAVVNALGCR